MFKLFFHKPQANPYSKAIASNLLLYGLGFLLFGITILLNPDLIAYIIAILLIAIGSVLLGTWWRLKQAGKREYRQSEVV